jgi:hypothetical protein
MCDRAHLGSSRLPVSIFSHFPRIDVVPYVMINRKRITYIYIPSHGVFSDTISDVHKMFRKSETIFKATSREFSLHVLRSSEQLIRCCEIGKHFQRRSVAHCTRIWPNFERNDFNGLYLRNKNEK